MTDTTVIYQDAFIFLFIFILIWILYSFEYPILDKLSNESVKRYLDKIPSFKKAEEGEEEQDSNSDPQHQQIQHKTQVNEQTEYDDYSALLTLMRRVGFALVLLFCLPVETVHMFKSNAQYYWSILAFSIAIYQCIKLLVFEQLEQFEGNRFVYRLIRNSKREELCENQVITLAFCWSLFWVIIIYFL